MTCRRPTLSISLPKKLLYWATSDAYKNRPSLWEGDWETFPGEQELELNLLLPGLRDRTGTQNRDKMGTDFLLTGKTFLPCALFDFLPVPDGDTKLETSPDRQLPQTVTMQWNCFGNRLPKGTSSPCLNYQAEHNPSTTQTA